MIWKVISLLKRNMLIILDSVSPKEMSCLADRRVLGKEARDGYTVGGAIIDYCTERVNSVNDMKF